MIVTGVVAERVKLDQSSSLPDKRVPMILAGRAIAWAVAAVLFAADVSPTDVVPIVPAQPLPSVRVAVNWIVPAQENPVSLRVNVWVPTNVSQLAATVAFVLDVVVRAPAGPVPDRDKASPLMKPVKSPPSDPNVGSNGAVVSAPTIALMKFKSWEI
jgi:hypothetical protein